MYGIAGKGYHNQGGTHDCPPTSSPTRITLGASAQEGGFGACQQPCCWPRHRQKLPPRLPGGTGSGTAHAFWHWSSMSSLPSCRHCYLLLPAAIKISSVINYLQTFWSKNSFITLSLTLKLTLSELCYLLFLCPVKNLKVLFLLIARDLVAI